ncbi:ARM repeat-containing protein [Armillaria solidipes]|uniref:ARM repeat-containing protein n=1 Tax=Armillaria solidipes TaxID=1076256 RepID=A0A2H3BAU8_9AGAR|nr:ARM repeat-containing protein [Armillaria solidipes]
MLSDEDDRIKAGSASCLFQLAKHWHHRQILEDSDVVRRLRSMMRGEPEGARLASIQCLSQLILNPEEENEHEADRTGVHDKDAELWEKHQTEVRSILSEQPGIWIRTLYDLLDSKDQRKETLGASCLSRLVKIDSVRDEFSKNDGLPMSIERLIRLLGTHYTQAHAASSLGSMSTCLKDVIAPYHSQMLHHLMQMIKDKNSKSKGAGVACLSEYFVKDGGMRELILQREDNLLVDLMTSLFGEHDHCHYHDKGAVVNAFASIATHSESLMQLKQKRITHVLVDILCVERWLSVKEGVTLLEKIILSDPRIEMINGIIDTLVAIGTNGANLYRTQHFFCAIYGPGKILEANPVLALDASVMKTIVKAMTYPHSRMKAVEFLNSVAMRAENCPVQVMREIHLLEKIVEIGDGSDYDALFAVRMALEVFASIQIHPKPTPGPSDCIPYTFDDLLLKSDVFAILTKDIDWDVTHTFREGHNLRQNIKAQEPGVRCIQKLIAFDKARMMLFDEKIVNKLLNILAAFKDEPESGERLRLYSPKYDGLLEKTLSYLVTFEDSRSRLHDDKDLREKLRRFITVPEPGSSSSDAFP